MSTPKDMIVNSVECLAQMAEAGLEIMNLSREHQNLQGHIQGLYGTNPVSIIIILYLLP